MNTRSAHLPTIAALLLFSGGIAAAEPVKAGTGSLFKPGSVPSLGALTVPAGATVTFDTGSATGAPTVSGHLSGKGAIGLSASGTVQVALFAFDSIALADGAHIDVIGDRGLVLLSKGKIVLNTVIAVSGGKGHPKSDPQVIGQGGPGADGGEYGKTLASSPPPSDAGDGGPPLKDSGKPGRGFGAGFCERVRGLTSGGGGAYGGAGGDASEGSGGWGPARRMKGGSVYGDPALVDLLGGSGGAGASFDRGSSTAGGGGAGGAIALISLSDITIGAKGAIRAVGGAGGLHSGGGGGGSGGAILLAAPQVTWASGAILDVSGGVGATGGPNVAGHIVLGRDRRSSGSGGGGGGGRIAIYSKTDLGKPGKNQVEAIVPADVPVNVDGGLGGYMANDGQPGSWYDGAWMSLE